MTGGPVRGTSFGRGSLVARVDRTIGTLALLNGGERVLVAVSGGADSICLLHVLKALAKRWSLSLHAFHMNHLLRGQEALADEEFVQDFCRRMEVPCFVARADVQALARSSRESLEEAGRSLRYSLLDQTAEQLGCQRIATGHNADDNAETLLLNLVRGAGRNGLGGIPPVRDRVIRPLLEVSRAEIEAYLAVLGIKFRRDASNEQVEFRRNFIRHRVLPLLREMNPQVVGVLNRTARVLAEEDAWLDEQVSRMVARTARPEHGGYLIDRTRLLAHPRAVQRRLIKLLFPQLTYDAVEDLLALALRPTGRRRLLTGGLVAYQEPEGLHVGPQTTALILTRELKVPGQTVLPELDMVLETQVHDFPGPRLESRGNGRSEAFDLDDLKLPLVVRARRSGDRFVPFGGHEQKLKDVLIKDKVPRRRRSLLPVVCDQKGILWVIGNRRSDRARVGTGTRRVLVVSAG